MKEISRFLSCLPLALCACTGDHIADRPGADTSDDIETCTLESGPQPTGLFTNSAEFPTEGCEAGLGDDDPTGLWQFHMPGAFTATPVRLSLSCEQGLGAEIGSMNLTETAPAAYTSISEESWLIRSSVESNGFKQIRAINICAATEAGYFGHSVECFEYTDQNGQETVYCTRGQFEMQRFGRKSGEDQAEGLSLVSEFSGSAEAPWPAAFTANVAVEDGIAYVARGSDGLRIVDVSDPAAPTELGYLPANNDDFNDVMIVDDPEGKRYALLAGNYTGMNVVDVDDPTAPVLVGTHNPFQGMFSGTHRLLTERIGEQTRAYLADGSTAKLYIYDVSDPAAPTELGSYAAADPNWGFHASSANQGMLYINAGYGGMLVVDATDPASTELVGRFESDNYSHMSWPMTAGGRTVAIHGDEGYDAHAKVIDVDPESETFLSELGSYQTRPEVSIHNMVAAGERAYLAYYQDGVRVLDLSDPTSPSLAAYFNTWDPETAPGAPLEGAVDLEVDSDAGLIYVADTPRGLLILSED